MTENGKSTDGVKQIQCVLCDKTSDTPEDHITHMIDVHDVEDTRPPEEANFYDPDPEVEDSDVLCPVCRKVAPASEMEATVDQVDESVDGAVLHCTRYYICSDECGTKLMFSGGLIGQEEDTDTQQPDQQDSE